MNEKLACPIARAASALLPCRGRPRAGDAAQIGERILDAAWQVLLDIGPEALTLDKVAGAARASKQTIYARYDGKRALLLAVLDRRVDVATAGLGDLPNLPTPHATFAALLVQAMAAFNQPEKLMLDRVIDWIDALGGEAGERATRVALADRFQVLMEQHIDTAVARWGLTIEDRGMAARFWLNGVVGHMRCCAEGDVDQARWIEAYTTYYLRGVAGL